MRDTIGRLHIPLIRELAAAAEFEDGDFVPALMRGFPLTGDLHAGGVGRALKEPHVAHGKKAAGRYVPTLSDLRARCPQINAATLARRPPDAEVAALVWEMSLKEQAEGRLGPFVELDQVNLQEILLVPRFGVWEYRAK